MITLNALGDNALLAYTFNAIGSYSFGNFPVDLKLESKTLIRGVIRSEGDTDVVFVITGKQLTIDSQGRLMSGTVDSVSAGLGDALQVKVSNLDHDVQGAQFTSRFVSDVMWETQGGAKWVGTNKSDYLDGSDPSDIFFGKGGNDTIYGDGDGDPAPSYGAKDLIYGGSGRDIIYAGPGNDRVFGGTGNDKIHAGVDTIYSGDGNDVLTGNLGADSFHFVVNKQDFFPQDRAVITDFRHGQHDKIVLDLQFKASFIGTNDFSEKRGVSEVGIVEIKDGWRVEVEQKRDLEGTEFSLIVHTDTQLVVSDFAFF